MRFALATLLALIALLATNQPVRAQATAAPAAPAVIPTAPAAVAATVNGQPISESAVQRGLERVPPDHRGEARQELVNFLIDNALVEQYLLQMQVAVDPKDVEKRLDEMKAEVVKGKKDFGKMLQEMKLTEAELRQHITADLRWEGFAAKQVDEAKLKALYDGNKDMFDGSLVRARHILLTPLAEDTKAGADAAAKLQELKKKVEADVAAGLAKLPANADALAREKSRVSLTDEAFATLAKKESACPSKAQGGDVGWFGRAGAMVEPFARAAYACKPYQMTDVVKTQFGYHLILVTERKPGRETKYEDVKDVVKEVYGDKLREAVIAMMRPRAKIVVAAAAKP